MDPANKDYHLMPPPKQNPDIAPKENAPLDKTPSNAWTKGKIPTDRKISAQRESIHEANDPDARKNAPSLFGRVTSAIGKFLSDAVNAIRSFLGIPAKEKNEGVEDLAFMAEIEESAKELGNMGENLAVGEKREHAVKVVDNLNQKAMQQEGTIKSMKPNAPTTDFGTYFLNDKTFFDTAVRNFKSHVNENTNEKDFNIFLQAVVDASERLNQTYQMEIEREN